ncbi:MAG: hypothetical protein ACREBU_01135 [Nitrososphaera sp.]
MNEEMNIIDPTKIRHVTIAGGKVETLSGLIDPASHLNLDYPDHKATICIIAEKFEKGAKVKIDSDGLIFASIQRPAYGHYGYVDYTQRLTDLMKAVEQNQEIRKAAKKSA